MKRINLTALLACMASCALAQKTTPLYEAYFHHQEDMEQDDGGGYHFKVGDSMVVSMSDDGYYKLMTRSGVLLEEGDTDEGDDNFVRHGKWTEYYASGKIKASGNYFYNRPYGHWQFFNTAGKSESEADILPITNEDGTVAYCKAMETVYYDNGKPKEERFYRAEPYNAEDRVLVDDPETGKSTWKKITVKAYRPKAFGTWIYYAADGTVEKREDKKE